MSPAFWMGQVRAHLIWGVADAAGAEFGLELHRGKELRPCPACGQERRHNKRGDRRGAVMVVRGGQGWECLQCGEKGDAVTLAAWLAVGRVPAAGDPLWKEVRRWCAARGLCERAEGDSTPYVRLRKPPPPPPPPPPPRRPPAHEVAELWDACRPLTEDPQVVACLKGRKLSAEVLQEEDLARALPVGARLPSWARLGRHSWTALDFRLLVGLFGSTGKLESLRARRVVAASDNLPKAVPPQGDRQRGEVFEVRGLVMGCTLTRLMLSGRAIPEGPTGPELVRRLGLVVAEGETDFWSAWSEWGHGRPEARAFLGFVNGSLSPEVVARIPTGATVFFIRQADLPDSRGRIQSDLYLHHLSTALEGRCVIRVVHTETL